MNDIIKIKKSLEDSGVLIDGVTENVKNKLKKQEEELLGTLLAPLTASSVKPVISSVVKGISGRGVSGAESIIYWQKYSCILWFFQNWIYSSRSIKHNQR